MLNGKAKNFVHGEPHQWIGTYSGKKVWPLDPHPDDIDIDDIAHSLSNICRFNGFTSVHYSVATHCLLGASICYRLYDKKTALAFLLHDAEEAYYGDRPGPIKSKEDKEILKRISNCIAIKFGVDLDLPVIHEIDAAMLYFEQMVLRPKLMLNTHNKEAYRSQVLELCEAMYVSGALVYTMPYIDFKPTLTIAKIVPDRVPYCVTPIVIKEHYLDAFKNYQN